MASVCVYRGVKVWSFSYLLLSVYDKPSDKCHKLIKVIVSKWRKKTCIVILFSAFDDARKTSVRCMDCNAELSAEILRWKSHHEKCPCQGRNSIVFSFFNR